MPNPEFTKKWWEKARPMLMGGTGLGKALASWEKSCVKDPSTFKKPEEFENAFAVEDEFGKAVAKAKGKAAKDKKILGYVTYYETESEKYFKGLHTEYEKRLSKYEQDRKDLLEFTESACEAMEGMLTEIKKLEKYLDDTEDEALTDLKENGGAMVQMYYNQGKPAYNQASKIVEEAKKRYEKDGKYIKERRGPDYDAASYGISSDDGAKLNHIFMKATETTNTASRAFSDIQSSFEVIEGEFKSLTEAFFQGKKSSEQHLKEASDMATTFEKIANAIGLEVDTASNAINTLNEAGAAASKGTLTVNNQKMVIPYLSKVDATLKKAKQMQSQMQVLGAKGLKRIPEELHRDRTLKPTIDRVKMALMKAMTVVKKYEEEASEAQNQAKLALKATPV